MAEILITLGIIGIVAALTIPSLVQKANDEEFKSLFKKEYSIANSAFRQAAADNGGTIVGYSSISGHNSLRGNDLKDFVKPYLSYVKDCNISQRANCFPPEAEYHTYAGVDFPSDWRPPEASNPYYATLILKDGSLWWFSALYDDMGSCTSTRLSTNNVCGMLSIDSNGAKKPNQAGYDLFTFYVTADGTIIPLGTKNDYYKNSYSKTIGFNPRANYMLGIED